MIRRVQQSEPLDVLPAMLPGDQFEELPIVALANCSEII